MPQTELNNWEIISLLCVKNWNVLRNSLLSFFLTILSPATFIIFLAILRGTVKVDFIAEQKYKTLNATNYWDIQVRNNTIDANTLKTYTDGRFNYDVFIPKNTLAYTPNDNTAINDVMKKAATHLSLESNNVLGYEDSKALYAAMKYHSYLAGIIFTTNKTIDKLPPNLEFTIVYPSEVRDYWDNCIGSNWRTNNLYDPFYRYLQRYPTNPDGGFVGYFREGFVGIQNAISLAYITSRTKQKEEDLPKVEMRRFPVPKSHYDPFLENINCCLSLAIIIGYLYPTTSFVKLLVREKSLFLKDALYIYGVTETVRFFGWLISAVLQFFIASIISVILLKIHWKEGFGILTHSSLTVLAIYMLAYNLTSVCFCYLVSTFFQRPTGAITIHSIVWVFTYFPYTVTLLRVRWHAIVFVVVGLFSNTAMAMGMKQVIDMEKFGDGVSWGNIFNGNEQDEAYLSVGAVVLILLGQAVAYTLIGMTIEKNRKKSWLIHFTDCSLIRQSCLSIREYFRAKPSTEEGSSIQYSGSDINLSKSHSSITSKKRSPTDLLKSESSLLNKVRSKTEVIEIEGINKKTIVDIQNLCLKIDDIKVVNDVTMQLYEGEINVLLGTNGSGKSMLLSAIIGRIPATRGRVLINGVDITNIRDLDHSYVGVSLNDDMLYPELTVSDQITFFCRLKGFRGERLRVDVKKYLNAMNLSSKANLVTHTLTRGVRQHLCACCALCGGSKFVILDQPSSAMDMSARKLLWDLLIKEKRGRTILIATHSTDEAEILADRIGIMTNGKLKCFGSQYFLKSLYGSGKRLTCSKDANCDVDAVSKFIRNYIPKIDLESHLCNELSYRILNEDIDTLVNLLSKIEKNLKSLQLNSFTITELTFEDIFLYMCEDITADGPSSAQIKRLMNGSSLHVTEYESLFTQKSSDKQSITKEMRAVFFKRWYYMKGNVLGALLQFVLPILVICLSIYVPSSDLGKDKLQPMTYQLNQYPSSISLTELRTKDNKANDIQQKYVEIVDASGSVHRHEDTKETMKDYILKQQKISDRIGAQYLIGATFNDTVITAWFNNYPLHTVPLSLNMVYNSILRSYKSSRISLTLEPLPFVTAFDPDQMLIHVQLSNIMLFYIAFVMCCICAIVISSIINERVSTFKLLQYINGLQPSAYLIGNLFYDIIKVITIGIIIIVIVAIASLITYAKNNNMDSYGFGVSMYFFMMLIFFAFGMSNFAYCVASLFNNPLTGSIAVLLFTVYGGVLFVTLKEIYIEQYTYNIALDEGYLWFYRIFPVFAFCNSLNRIIGAVKHREVCNDIDIFWISKVLKKCEVAPNCCIEPDLLKWGNTYSILPDIICLLIFGIICMTFFFIVEYNSDFRVSSIGHRNKKSESMIFDGFTQFTQKAFALIVNATVGQEKQRVIKLQPHEYQTKPLVMYNVSKSYRGGIAVHQLYLKIEHGECFGILGINGSGKSTIIKLLVGHDTMTAGDIYVKGIRMKTKIYDMYKHTGLCPKPYAIPYEFIVYQVMKLLCILRGIPDTKILRTCDSLAKVFGFFQYLYIPYGKLSSGNKLRVCAAIAMIGGPTIMYYDTLTSGIDPAGRRLLWNIYARMQKMGKSVLFTSFNTNECARICTRLAIIHDGTFHYLDTPHNLSNNHMVGCLLYVQIIPKYVAQRSRQSEGSGTSGEDVSHTNLARQSLAVPNISSTNLLSPFLKVQTFVENTFSNAIVKDQRGRVIIFYIPRETASLSDIYLQMGRNAFNLNVAHFSLTRTTLEMLFCDLAEENIERTDSMQLEI